MKQNLLDASHVYRLMLMNSTRLQPKKKSPSIAMSILLEVMIVGNSAVADLGFPRGGDANSRGGREGANIRIYQIFLKTA